MVSATGPVTGTLGSIGGGLVESSNVKSDSLLGASGRAIALTHKLRVGGVILVPCHLDVEAPLYGVLSIEVPTIENAVPEIRLNHPVEEGPIQLVVALGLRQ